MLGKAISLATRFIPRTLLHRVGVAVGWCLAQVCRGHRYQDPIDGFGYRTLLPYGRMAQRRNALAPKSLSLERHRLIWLYLHRELDLANRPYRILHMAPEWALRKRLAHMENLRYTTADLSSPWAQVHCDIQALPFPDESFDLILCNHVLEHIPDDRLAMRELYRVLAPGGTAILLVPIDENRADTLEDPAINTPKLRERYYHQRDHLRLYGRDYAERLQAAGFLVQVRDYAAELPPEIASKCALRAGEKLYLGHKGKFQQ